MRPHEMLKARGLKLMIACITFRRAH